MEKIFQFIKEKIKRGSKYKNLNFILIKVYQIYRSYFPKDNKFIQTIRKNSSYQNIHFFNNLKNDLSILCKLHGSDKGYVDFKDVTPYGWKAHTYTGVYNNLFNHCKEQIKLIFECGIGTNNPNLVSNMTRHGKPGASLRVWRDYFKNALIYGADIDKDILIKENRIETFYVDQLNTSSINEMWSNINKSNFDIIIDDGLHAFEPQINMFLNSFDKLKKNGIYIIEDVGFIYLEKLANSLSKYNPEIIALSDNNHKHGRGDNNLILIRKS